MKLLIFFFLCIATCLKSVLATEAHIATVIEGTTNMHKCNAFFVSPDSNPPKESPFLVTTASCVFSISSNHPKFIVGVGDSISVKDALYDVEQIHIHPNYSKNPDLNNVAVLVIDRAATNVLVYEILNSTDLYGMMGLLHLWRFVGQKFTLTDSEFYYVTEDIYERATNLPLRESEIAVMSNYPLTSGYFDEGAPFTLKTKLLGNKVLRENVDYVLGFLGLPHVERKARFFALYSIPYFSSWIYDVMNNALLH